MSFHASVVRKIGLVAKLIAADDGGIVFVAQDLVDQTFPACDSACQANDLHCTTPSTTGPCPGSL